MSTTDSSKRRRFAIALSFPGERREYVEQVANALLPAFGGEQGKSRIFYDDWHEGLIIGYASSRKLQGIYANDSDLIVPFFCEDYLKKNWCGVELRAIEQLVFDREFDRVMPFRFDAVEIPGGFKQDIFPVVSDRSPEDIARVILNRYRKLHPGRLEEAPDHGDRRSASVRADISRIMKYAPSDLIGREAETEVLNDAWDQVMRDETKRPHILTFVALGGEGKTSVVAKWAVDLAFQGWPGCEAVLAWSFYSQGTREQLAASSDLFLNDALAFFGDAAMAASAAGAFDKGRRLAQLVGERRALLILDGLEPLQYAPTSPTPGELKDQGIAALLKGLAGNSRGLCVVTTRYSIPDLRAYAGKTVDEKKLARLSTEAGVALLQSFGVKGSLRKTIPSPDGRTLNEYDKLVEDVQGHALTLNLLGSYLRDAHGGDIRKRDLIRLPDADAEEQGHAFHVMDAYVESLANGGRTADDQAKGRRALALLRLLGLFDRPASAGTLAALWEGEAIAGLTEPLIGISEAQRNLALQRLEDARVLTVIREHGSGALVALDAHPLLREYFGQRLREAQPEAWRAAHRRLYEHLCATTPDKPDATLEDLQPLYQAVAHGCLAGLQQEACDKVYFDRIQRGREAYSSFKLGALGSDLGAIACFFEAPWSRVSPALTEADQAWLLNDAAFCLRALGRLTEAIEPMRAGLESYIKQERWGFAARLGGNLSELELTLGDVVGSVGDAEQSVTYADRSGDAFARMSARTSHAHALHLGGRRDEAEASFREAEQMEAESQPDCPLLYSLRGFQYCELLLSAAERKAGKAIGQLKQDEDLALCRVVAERAAQTLKWEEGMRNAPLLDFALHHLTLGRAALYAAILESRGRQRETVQLSPPTSEQSLRGFTTAATELDQAVSGLRRASVQHHLPRGLLTRAWLRSLTGARSGSESAQSDLDEAWEIAERGPMPLFLADIHLYRARLFLREVKYPWDKNPDGTRRGPKDDLAAARVIIERCGYWRRKEELDDADAAAKSWPDSMPPVAKGKNVMRKTIVELDLKGYSDVARELEENLSAEVVMHFNDQIQTFVDTGLSAVSLHREDAVMATTGDGAILALDSPSIAHRYALAVHHACRLHNQERTVASAKRWFRVGIATGDLAIEANAGVKRMAGSVIARAVRLETASNVGEILVDTETYAGLSDQQKLLYGGEETIHGKRDEVFAARRCVAVPGIAVAPTSPAKARSVPAKPNAALEIWREKLEYLQGQFAIVTSPTQKFELKSQIAEAKEMIEELGG